MGAWLGWPEPSRDMDGPKRDRGKPSLTKENIAPAELETEIAAVAVHRDGPLARPTGQSPVTTRSLLFADVGARCADTGALVETNLAARISLSDVFEIGLVFGRIG